MKQVMKRSDMTELKKAMREAEKRIAMMERAMCEEKSEEARKTIARYNNILSVGLLSSKKINWIDIAGLTSPPTQPTYEQVAAEVKIPKKSFWELVFPSRKAKRQAKEEEARNIYNIRLSEYELYVKEMKEQERKLRADFKNGDPSAVEKYISLVLKKSNYPPEISKTFEVQFEPLSKTFIIDYLLPNPEQIPRILEFKYIVSKKETRPVEMKQKQFDAFYESVLYQITLRTIHEVFQCDSSNNVQSVVFNGWVDGIDRATGTAFRSCVLSCQAFREEFQKLNLSQVDPKLCFRSLKGLNAGPLAQLAPVKPVMEIRRDDVRFVESRPILDEVESIPNLATMDWVDFEHLVRELFERFFAKDGGEVRVTRASRDWGVDAIAFDPDPIRGGKIVIQAKRYNNVVPVSAVRDLYGTVINEGAIKGILVTTSYFGNDSREFVRDKPISLIDGSNLIYLFQQYGYKVRIDLQKSGTNES